MFNNPLVLVYLFCALLCFIAALMYSSSPFVSGYLIIVSGVLGLLTWYCEK